MQRYILPVALHLLFCLILILFDLIPTIRKKPSPVAAGLLASSISSISG